MLSVMSSKCNMKNICEISSDGHCVYLTSVVKSNLIGKIILIFFNAAVISLLALLTNIFSDPDSGGAVIGFLIVLVVYVSTLVRYTLWNFWGRENISISTETIKYSYDYGFFSTKEKIIHFENLSTGFDCREDETHGKVYFYNLDGNKQQMEVFSTTVVLMLSDLQKIDELLDEIFTNKFLEQNRFIPFTLN